MHPSLLPKYRGPAPLHHTLLNGDDRAGVCVMELSKGRFDEGKILLREERAVAETDRFLDLHHELADKGSAMVMEALSDFERYRANAKAQSEFPEAPCKAPKVKRDLGLLDPQALSAREVRHKGGRGGEGATA